MKKHLLLLFSLFSKIIFAYECPPNKQISIDLFNNYDVIFLGKIDSVASPSDRTYSTVYFLINELYKGTAKEYQEVNYDCSSSSMMSFSKGEEWLIYANYKKFNLLTVTLCSHSRKYFTNNYQDYYQIEAQRTFDEEKIFLKTTLRTHTFIKNNELLQEQGGELLNRNKQPSGIVKLLLLLISLITVVIIFFITKKKKTKRNSQPATHPTKY